MQLKQTALKSALQILLATFPVFGIANVTAAQQPNVAPKATIYGNFGSATANCIVTGDQLDVDITLRSARGGILNMSGTVSTEAGHFRAFTHLSNPSSYTVRHSVQFSLRGVEPGEYTATVYGTGTTTQSIFGFTTFCTFQ